MRVSVNIIKTTFLSGRVCGAMAEGIEACGDKVDRRSDLEHRMKGYDAAVFWGYWEPCQLIERSCREAGIPFVYVDLAYWGREQNYYKAAVNARHPTTYLMLNPMPSDRWDALGVKIQPWRRSEGSVLRPIVVAGMSGKGAWSWGFQGGQYEKWAIGELRRFSERPIIYRPKPNWAQAKPITDTAFDRTSPVGSLLNTAHCVVTHHSNVGSDAIVAGVPVFTRHGAAIHMGLPDNDLSRIEAPAYPDGREQWAANMAYTQWTLAEMSAGKCWGHLKQRVLEVFK
jgi:hypothetical protein